MSGYEAESYDNGARFAAAVIRIYGVRLAARDVLNDAQWTDGPDSLGKLTPNQAWLAGALDTALGAALDAKADGRLS